MSMTADALSEKLRALWAPPPEVLDPRFSIVPRWQMLKVTLRYYIPCPACGCMHTDAPATCPTCGVPIAPADHMQMLNRGEWRDENPSTPNLAGGRGRYRIGAVAAPVRLAPPRGVGESPLNAE